MNNLRGRQLGRSINLINKILSLANNIYATLHKALIERTEQSIPAALAINSFKTFIIQ